MFQSLVEDPDDPTNSVINMEGTMTTNLGMERWSIDSLSPSLSHTHIYIYKIVFKKGIALLGEKLGIDVTEDIRILVLLWKMDCKDKPGCITPTEWTNGCEALNIESFEAMMELLPSLELGFLENSEFKDFYKFCFKFNLSGTHRTLPMEVVVELLQLVLKDRDPYERVPSLCKFLQQPDNTYTCITMDQWCSFFDFNMEVGTDISHYDESTSAWPVLIDEFVEYLAKAPAPW